MGRLVPHLCLPLNFAFISAGIRTPKKAAQAPAGVFALRLVLLPRLVVAVSSVWKVFVPSLSSIAQDEQSALAYQCEPN